MSASSVATGGQSTRMSFVGAESVTLVSGASLVLFALLLGWFVLGWRRRGAGLEKTVPPLSVELVSPDQSRFPVSWSESTHVGLFLTLFDPTESGPAPSGGFAESPDLPRVTAMLERAWQLSGNVSEARIFCRCLYGFEGDVERVASIPGCRVLGVAGKWQESLELGVTSGPSLLEVVAAIWAECEEFTICFGVGEMDASPFDLEARRLLWETRVPSEAAGVFTMCYGHPVLALAVLPRSPGVPWLGILQDEL